MDPANRSIIAYIAGRLITRAGSWWIQDHDRGRAVHFEGSFEPGSIMVYSHELNSHVSGFGTDGKYSLFQHGIGGAVNLIVNIEQQTFSGWEHRSCFHFFGNVEDRTIRLYDYQSMELHLYTI